MLAFSLLFSGIRAGGAALQPGGNLLLCPSCMGLLPRRVSR